MNTPKPDNALDLSQPYDGRLVDSSASDSTAPTPPTEWTEERSRDLEVLREAYNEFGGRATGLAIINDHLPAAVREIDRLREEGDAALQRAEELDKLHCSAMLELARVKGEREEYHTHYLGACKTIAAMHAASMGGAISGAKRGVVEDIADLWQQNAALREGLRACIQALTDETSVTAKYAGPTCQLGPLLHCVCSTCVETQSKEALATASALLGKEENPVTDKAGEPTK